MTGKIAGLFAGRLPAAALFDLDGTLVDSAPDLAVAVDRMLAELGYATVGEQCVRRWIGNGARKLISRSLAHVCFDGDEALLENALLNEAHQRFIYHYHQCCADSSCLYPSVAEVLNSLSAQGVKQACVTNKPKQFTGKILKNLGIDSYFQLALSGDSLVEKKPHPLPLLHAMQELGVDNSDCLMVGDSQSDVAAARAAGIKVLCMTYGYNHGQDVRELQADDYADSFAQLL